MTVNEKTLRMAIKEEQFVPYFQPIVQLETGRITGFELLARWVHPVRGIVRPLEFIPQVERCGLLSELTESLFAQAAVIAATWPEVLTLWINISPRQLAERSLSSRLARIADDVGFSMRQLTVEITESALIGNVAIATLVAEEFHSIGVQLAVDDFGTGFSDFRRLGDLPFDILKLDTAFVWTMLHAQETRKAATSLIRLANRLGLTTVAEGVEEQAQADLLIYLGCECGQGWLYGKPNCWPEVWKTLKTWNPIPASPSRALLPAYDGNALSVLNLCAPGGPFLPEDNAALGNSTKIKCV